MTLPSVLKAVCVILGEDVEKKACPLCDQAVPFLSAVVGPLPRGLASPYVLQCAVRFTQSVAHFVKCCPAF
jgi:hypothetical protein